MKSTIFKNLITVFSPVSLGWSVFCGVAIAEEIHPSTSKLLPSQTTSNLQSQTTEISQVTSVDELADVQPTDWAFSALESLVKRYGCIAGFPDTTYRGSQAITRYEFAAGLNACLDYLESQISGNGNISATDLAIVRRLQEDFAPELTTLRGRIDSLESRTAQLEANQVSTTTQLTGETIFGLTATGGENRALNPLEWAGVGGLDSEELRQDLETNPTFAYRARLFFNTSFTGRDRLTIRLQGANFAHHATGSDETRLAYSSGGDGSVVLNKLFYRTPIGDRFTFSTGTTGLLVLNFFNPTNPFLSNDATGVISQFGRHNPAIFRAKQGAGAGLSFDGGDRFTLSGFYMVPTGDASNPETGLFDGAFTTGVQLYAEATDDIDVSLAYLHSYTPSNAVNLFGQAGTDFSQTPFLNVSDGRVSSDATSADRLGIQTSIRATEWMNFAGWFGAVFAQSQSGRTRGDEATILNWAANVAFPDLGGEGNLLGLVVGQTPHVVSNDNEIAGIPIEDRVAPWHYELFYRIAFSDKLSVTPGVFYIDNPEGDRRNDGLWVGAVRATFKF